MKLLTAKPQVDGLDVRVSHSDCTAQAPVSSQCTKLNTTLNPHGVVHQLRTFSAVNHYKLAGSPTPGDSWFPGYWVLSIVRDMPLYLGWAYFTPQSTRSIFLEFVRSLLN